MHLRLRRRREAFDGREKAVRTSRTVSKELRGSMTRWLMKSRAHPLRDRALLAALTEPLPVSAWSLPLRRQGVTIPRATKKFSGER